MPYISCDSLCKLFSCKFSTFLATLKLQKVSLWQIRTEQRTYTNNCFCHVKNFSLAVWYLSLTNHAWGWASESSTTRLPPSNSLCLYCMSPENHILRRGTQSTAMPPWTGKLVTQSELFTDDCVAPLKILQSLLSLEANLWRVQRRFKGKQ